MTEQTWWPVAGGPFDGREFGYPPFEMAPGQVVVVGRLGHANYYGRYEVSADGNRVVWVEYRVPFPSHFPDAGEGDAVPFGVTGVPS